MTFRLLHTSDWHLGAALYGRSRHEEHGAFLDWLLERLEERSVDLLIIAGDVFDNTTPSHESQALYYDFLVQAARPGRTILVTGGNHDSPSFLEAPRGLLEHLRVYVIGAKGETPEDDVMLVRDAQGEPRAVVCAVPYLRERDLGRMAEGEDLSAHRNRIGDGIAAHYASLWERAEAIRRQQEAALPIIATGHLYVAGGGVGEGREGTERFIGALGQVPAELFPPELDYLALGHLHRPQGVAGREHWRYSGSPLPMTFAAAADKGITLVEWRAGTKKPAIEPIEVPRFRKLARVSGDLGQLQAGLEALKTEGKACWVEVVYTGGEGVGNLKASVEGWVEGSPLEVLRIEDRRARDHVLARQSLSETLADLDPLEVFRRRLERLDCDPGSRETLERTYRQALSELAEADGQPKRR